MATLLFFLRDALTAHRVEFPDDCEVRVGRGTDAGVVVRGEGARWEVRVGSRTLSEEHCVVRIAAGAVTVEDRTSRNGTLLRAPAGERIALEGRALYLGTELVVREDDARWRLPDTGLPDGHALCLWMNEHLAGTGLRADLVAPEAGSLPLAREAKHLALRASHGTVDADHAAWSRWCAGRFNALHDKGSRDAVWTFRAASPARRRALEQAQRAANASLPVLISGPTGVGKDLLAQEIHDRSSRRASPFVTLACARVTLPTEVLAYVTDACGGTLLLDDPTAIPMAAQPGVARLIEGDLRVIATTAAEPEDASRLHPELYYRLAGVRIEVPALTSPDAAEVATQLLPAQGVTGDERARIVTDVTARSWPGGVRELRQRIERATQLRVEGETLWEAWTMAHGAVTASTMPPLPTTHDPRVQPAALARLASDLAFLLAARTAPDRRTLARRTQMTYQGADQRLDVLGVEIGGAEAIDARLRATVDALRRQLRDAPTLAAVVRAIVEE